jgi:cyclopropane fatty-acyl-phospholipid synthase-like methyltransferase
MTLQTIKHYAARVEDLGQKALTAVGLGQSEERIAADAQTYWSNPEAKRWAGNSHWQNSDAFEGDRWQRMGAEHLEMFDRGARAAGFDRPLDRIVDWGCGGGANAVAFASRCKELVGVDPSRESLEECGRQLAGDSVDFQPVLIDVAAPEKALAEIEYVDAFVSYYVLELVPTPAYGLRLMKLAYDMLIRGGIAHVQIKYATSRLSTRPRGRNYLRGQAQATSYEIHTFWEAMQRIGFTPVMNELVPQNELDERYAYFTLLKP